MQELSHVGDFNSNAQHPFGILRVLGGWGNVSGPGLFMFRSVIAGTYTAIITGIGASLIASSIWGTAALPFIYGSSIGFALGSLRWYDTAMKEALLDLQRYPSLLRMHIVAGFPWKPELGGYGVHWFTPERFGASWQMKSMLLASWLTAQPAIEEIRSRTIANLVESYANRFDEERAKQKVSDERAFLGSEQVEE